MTAHLIRVADPFQPLASRTVETLDSGASLGSLVPATEHPIILVRNGEAVLRADWAQAIRDDDHLVLIQLPLDGGGGSNPLQALLSIAVFAFAPELGMLAYESAVGAAAVTSMGYAIAGAAATMVGMALVNSFIGPPKLPSNLGAAAMAAPSPTYSLQAQGNMARLGNAIPVGYGQMAFYPDLAAQPYVEYANNEQYLYQLLCIGQGLYDIASITLGDSPLSAFSEVEYEVIPPNGTITLFPMSVITSHDVGGQTLPCYTASASGNNLHAVAHGLSSGRTVYVQHSGQSGFYAVATAPGPDDFTLTGFSGSGTWTISPVIGPFVAVPSGKQASAIGLDMVMPRGMYYANDDGSLASRTANWMIEYQTIDDSGNPTGPWTACQTQNPYTDWSAWTALPFLAQYDDNGNPIIPGVPANTNTDQYQIVTYNAFNDVFPYQPQHRHRDYNPNSYTYTAASTTPQRFSTRFYPPRARYQIRAYRTDLQETQTRAANELVWAGLRAYLPDTRNYGNVTLLAMRVRATNNLTAQASRLIKVTGTRKLPIWNGSGWSAPTATRSIAWALADACRNTSYGAGLPDSRLDLVALQAIDTMAQARGDTFDAAVGFWEALTKIAQAARIKPFLQGGIIHFVRDQQVNVPVALFSTRNIKAGSFSIDYLMPTDATADAVDVTYFDTASMQPRTVTASLPGSQALKHAQIDLTMGVTGRDQAYREGLYQAACNRYRRRIIKFTTEMEGYIPAFGDLVAIQHDMPAWGQSAEVTGWDAPGKTLTLSEALTWGSGTHYLGLRKRDGGLDGPYVVTQGSDAYHVVLASSPSFTPYTGQTEERTHITFGWGNTWRQLARITRITPRGLYSVDIEAVNEDNNVHSADQGVTTPTASSSQLGTTHAAPVIQGLTARSLPLSANSVMLTWAPAPGARYYLIEQAPSTTGAWHREATTSSPYALLEVLYGNNTAIRVCAVGDLAQGAWAQIDAIASAIQFNNIVVSGGTLDPLSKIDLMTAVNTLVTDQTTLDAQANLWGIGTAAFDNALNDLTGFLATCTSPVDWTDISGYTVCDGLTLSGYLTSANSERLSLVNVLTARAGTTAVWSGVDGRPADYQIRNNLIDPTAWKPGQTPPWTLNGPAANSSIVMEIGPKGASAPLWKATTSSAPYNGGFVDCTANSFTVDPTKTYRFAIPFMVPANGGTGGAMWFGPTWGDTNSSLVCNLNTANRANNPYFAVLNRNYMHDTLPGKWVLMVGYVFPAGSTGSTADTAGPYRLDTGARLNQGWNYCWHPSATHCEIRAFADTCNAGDISYIGAPMVHVVDGSEPSLRELLADAAIFNSSVTINDNGTLSGAGGGQIKYLPVPDTRAANTPPSGYPVGHQKEFKQCAAIGLSTSATFCVLETIKGWTDSSGGQATQWAYVASGEIWKRSAGCGDGAWGAWVRDLDRSLYTGDLNATWGATFGVNIVGQAGTGDIATDAVTTRITLTDATGYLISNMT